MQKFFLLFLLLVSSVFPAVAFGADTSCTGSSLSCSCTNADGEGSLYDDTSIIDGDSCAAYCSGLGSTSYAFFCDEDSTPKAAGNISDYLDAIAASVGIATITKEDPAIPALNVPIPGLNLKGSVEVDENGYILSNMIGLYVNAIFSYGITIAAIFAVLMLTIAGFQYMTAGGDKGAVSKAKARMSNTLFGIVLLMATYSIAFLIDPRTTYFNSLGLQSVAEIQLAESTSGNEGSGTPGGVGMWENLREPYRTIVSEAKASTTCIIPDLISSPTGTLPKQGDHHWYDRGRNGDYRIISDLDWAAPWGDEILAPFEGTVTYQKQTNDTNPCGNRIYITSKDGSAKLTICHAKDFVATGGTFEATRSVAKGDVLGHLGGLCCSGQTSAQSVTKCNAPGTACTDPTREEDCDCQLAAQAGNTTGPHVHMGWRGMPTGMFLACLE